MTEAEIQEAISGLYDASAEVPDVTDDDYLTRRILMNRAVKAWANDKGFYWDELKKTKNDQVVVAGTSSYAAPTDFRRAAGTVKLILNGSTSRYPVIKASDVDGKSDSSQYAYFDGNKRDGYMLHISPTPDTSLTGATISYQYQKVASSYAGASDITEIPDEEFIIHSVVAELYKQDTNFSAYQTSLSEAQEALKGMEIDCVANIDWQDNTTPDQTGAGFGV